MKRGAVCYGRNDVPKTLCRFGDRVDLWAIARCQFAADGLREEFFGEGPGELLAVFEEDRLEFVDVLELLTVWQFT